MTQHLPGWPTLAKFAKGGPSSLSFSQVTPNSRRVAELSGAFLVGGSGTLGDRTLSRRARTLETASTFLGVAYLLRSLQRVGPSSLSFSQRHLNSRRVAELSGAFLVGGSGTLGDRTLFAALGPSKPPAPSWVALPFAKFAKGGPLFSFFSSFFAASPQLTTRSRALWHGFRWSNLHRSKSHGSIFNIPSPR